MAGELKNRREELDSELRSFLGSDNVYFQPPENIRMKYPAIVYDLYRLNQRFADDLPYRKLAGYSVTVIDPANEINWVEDMLDNFSYCALERTYVADNINHYSFILFY